MNSYFPLPPKTQTIQELFPHLALDEVMEAEDVLDRYITLMVQIYERVEADPAAYAHFKALTAFQRATRLE